MVRKQTAAGCAILALLLIALMSSCTNEATPTPSTTARRPVGSEVSDPTRADSSASTSTIPLEGLAISLDYALASPWANINSLSSSEPGVIEFRMNAIHNRACDLRQNTNGEIEVLDNEPLNLGLSSSPPSEHMVSAGGATWILSSGAAITVKSGETEKTFEIPLPDSPPRERWKPGHIVADDAGTVWFTIVHYHSHFVSWFIGHVAQPNTPISAEPQSLGRLCEDETKPLEQSATTDVVPPSLPTTFPLDNTTTDPP